MAAKSPPITSTSFGGDVGGPIFREKLFFFFDYDRSSATLSPISSFLACPRPPPRLPISRQPQLPPVACRLLDSHSKPNVYLGKADWRQATTSSSEFATILSVLSGNGLKMADRKTRSSTPAHRCHHGHPFRFAYIHHLIRYG